MLDLNIGHVKPNKTIPLMNDYIVTFFNKYLYKKESASIEKLNKLYEKEISLTFEEKRSESKPNTFEETLRQAPDYAKATTDTQGERYCRTRINIFKYF